MTSKAELRAENEKLSEELGASRESVREGVLLRSIQKASATAAEKARVLNEKRANVHKGLIPVDDLRKLVRTHATEFASNGKLTTITLEVRDHSSLAQDIIDALTKPSFATGGIVSGGYTGVIPPYNDGSWLSRAEYGLIHGVTVS